MGDKIEQTWAKIEEIKENDREHLVNFILSVNNQEFTKECIERSKELTLTSEEIGTLISKVYNDLEFKRKCLFEKREALGLKGEGLKDVIKTIDDYELIKKCILKREELGLEMSFVVDLLSRIGDHEFSESILRKSNDVGAVKRYRQSRPRIEDIYDNLDFYLEMEGRTADKDTILRMYQKNKRILRCDFKILDYIKYFGEDKINLIVCYEDIQNKILELSEPKVLILSRCISYYERQYRTSEWTPLAQTILNNIYRIEDENLLQQILQQMDKNDFNMENLIDFLINPIFGNIIIEDFNNYKNTKKQKLEELKQFGRMDDLKDAILQKAFNHNLDKARYLVEKYGEDIDAIEDEQLKMYIRALKEIINLEDKGILREIYQSIEPSQIKIGNTFAIEKLLKIEYAKLYNNKLFKVKDAIRNEELGENVYEAGTDFSMIITSVKPYFDTATPVKNYFEQWNKDELGTQHLCCSNIRNDMICTAPIPYICFGFERMEEDSFITANNKDAKSNFNEFVSREWETVAPRCYAPSSIIDNTCGINEIDYYRIQNGEKKQPDYIVVFKANGQIKPEHWQNAKQAQREFGGKLPIVIVDVDKCLESEKNKVKIMVDNYKANPTQELFDQIKQKIKNNNLTCTNRSFNYKEKFCEDIDLENLEELLESASAQNRSLEALQDENECRDSVTADRLVTTKDLQECYKATTPEERKRMAKTISQIVNRINLNKDISRT